MERFTKSYLFSLVRSLFFTPVSGQSSSSSSSSFLESTAAAFTARAKSSLLACKRSPGKRMSKNYIFFSLPKIHKNYLNWHFYLHVYMYIWKISHILMSSAMARWVLLSNFSNFLATSLFRSQSGFLGAKFIRSWS